MPIPTIVEPASKTVQETFFNKIHKILADAQRTGKKVFDFSIGDPDLTPPLAVSQYFMDGLKDNGVFTYPDLYGERYFREAIAQWMEVKMNVNVDPDTEVLPLLGVKEGITHLALGILDAGDSAAYASPSYPIYLQAIELAGAIPMELTLYAQDDYIPTPSSWKMPHSKPLKLVYLNYPHNPTGAVLTKESAENIIRFANENDTAICMDCVYARISPGMQYEHVSMLSLSGAKERCIEMYSFSKDYNLPGIRLGFAVGSSKLIDKLKTIKSNVDVSAFKLVQQVGARLLQADTGGELTSFFQGNNDIYAARHLRIEQVLKRYDVPFFQGQGTFYLWFQPPAPWTDETFCEHIFQREGILLVPGSEFGNAGKGWCRIALSKPEEQISQLVEGLVRVLSRMGG